MTILQTSRDARKLVLPCSARGAGRWSGRRAVFGAAAFSLISAVACSSGSDEPTGGGTGGASSGGSGQSAGGASAGGATAGGASSTGGTSNAGGASNTGGTGGPGGSTKVIGTFQVELTPPNAALGTPPSTKVVGKVSDAPTPAAIVWEASDTSGSCKLSKPRVPFCDPACGADVCVEDGECQAYPTAKNVGTVTVTGIKNGAATSFTMDAVAGNYQPAGITLDYPGFDDTTTIKVASAGGDLAAFSLEAKGIKALTIDESPLQLESGKALALQWTAAASGAPSKIHVKLDISHHGGTKGMVECDTDDTGSLEIPAALVTKLLGLGVAGYPTIVLTRHTSGSAQTSLGVVALEVSSPLERAVAVPGLVSCDEDTDCPDGKKCQTDLSCK